MSERCATVRARVCRRGQCTRFCWLGPRAAVSLATETGERRGTRARARRGRDGDGEISRGQAQPRSAQRPEGPEAPRAPRGVNGLWGGGSL